MWNSTIMILIGGFTLAAALSKYNLAKILSSYILALAVQIQEMYYWQSCVYHYFFPCGFLMLLPRFMFSLIQPVLRSIPTDSPLLKHCVRDRFGV